ncbi:hypothetical protein DIPPA_22406 [Diplonema papillatum]|nr:hypothetical protein DIPPA_22406 [Diplonema papillatum]
MRVVLVAHECGVPQWHWEIDKSAELAENLAEATHRLRDMNKDTVLNALAVVHAKYGSDPPSWIAAAGEGAMIVSNTLEASRFGIEDQPTVDSSWAAFSEAVERNDRFFQNLAEKCTAMAVTLGIPEIGEFVDSLNETVGGLARDVCEKSVLEDVDTSVLTAPLWDFGCAVLAVCQEYIRSNQVRSSLPRLVSTEAYATRSKLPCATRICFGGARVAVDRYHWRNRVALRGGGFVAEANNIFFVVASDEENVAAESLSNLAALVKEAAEMASGRIDELERPTVAGCTPKQSLGCFVRAFLRAPELICENPALLALGVGCLVDSSPYSDAGQAEYISNLLSSVITEPFSNLSLSGGILDEDEADYHVLGDAKPEAGHALLFINDRLASVATKKGVSLLTSSDVLLLSAYVNGIFIANDGTAYNPGYGAAWDLLPTMDPPDEEKPGAFPPCANESDVAAAEQALAVVGINRANYLDKKLDFGEYVDALNEEGCAEEAAKLSDAFSLLEEHAPAQRRNGRPAPEDQSRLSIGGHQNSGSDSFYGKSSIAHEAEAPSLPSLRTLWLRCGTLNFRKPCMVFVDTLGHDTNDDNPTDRQSTHAQELEKKFKSVRVCFIEEMRRTRRGWSACSPNLLRHRMVAMRETVRERFAPVVDVFTTIEKTHFNIACGAYLDACPGLVHFIFVDRSRHNCVTSPKILPLVPPNSTQQQLFAQFTASEQASTEKGMAPHVAHLLSQANYFLHKNYTEAYWGTAGMSFYHKLWLQDDHEELPFPEDCLLVAQKRPWALRDHLVSACPRESKRGLRCGQLFVMYMGMVPLDIVRASNKRLLELAVPHFGALPAG